MVDTHAVDIAVNVHTVAVAVNKSDHAEVHAREREQIQLYCVAGARETAQIQLHCNAVEDSVGSLKATYPSAQTDRKAAVHDQTYCHLERSQTGEDDEVAEDDVLTCWKVVEDGDLQQNS